MLFCWFYCQKCKRQYYISQENSSTLAFFYFSSFLFFSIWYHFLEKNKVKFIFSLPVSKKKEEKYRNYYHNQTEFEGTHLCIWQRIVWLIAGGTTVKVWLEMITSRNKLGFSALISLSMQTPSALDLCFLKVVYIMYRHRLYFKVPVKATALTAEQRGNAFLTEN